MPNFLKLHFVSNTTFTNVYFDSCNFSAARNENFMNSRLTGEMMQGEVMLSNRPLHPPNTQEQWANYQQLENRYISTAFTIGVIFAWNYFKRNVANELLYNDLISLVTKAELIGLDCLCVHCFGCFGVHVLSVWFLETKWHTFTTN